MYRVSEYGAVADGETLCAAAESCCSRGAGMR